VKTVRSPFRIRNRNPQYDDPYLLQLIKENLGHYPSSFGLTDDKVLSLLNEHTRVILLTTKSGERIGFLSWTEKRNIMVLELCVIEKKFQRHGIASHYMKRLEGFARRKGFDTMRFYVDLKNEAAQKLYRSFGFKAKRTNPFTGTILMEKRIL
jgi:ribosomal protein S18 acetylase RimI-like enzyme